MLYRYYENGIRYTVEASNETEAKRRFNACKKSKRTEFKTGNPERRNDLPKRSKPVVAGTFEVKVINAYDLGFALGVNGRKRLSPKDKAKKSKVALEALNYGFNAGQRCA